MRNPRWTWSVAMAAMGLAASSPWIVAQTYRGLEPGSGLSNLSSRSNGSEVSAGTSNAKEGSDAIETPSISPAEAAMLRSRGARTLLRNGLDYIKYQDFEKALVYLREAERRSKELNPTELTSLKQGITSAQEGLRTPSSQVGYAMTRKPRAGSIAIAGKTKVPGTTDPATVPVSAQINGQSMFAQEDMPDRTAQAPVEKAMAPLPPETLAKELPSAAELARSKSVFSARKQYNEVGNSYAGSESQPLKAPTPLNEKAELAEVEPVESREIDSLQAATKPKEALNKPEQMKEPAGQGDDSLSVPVPESVARSIAETREFDPPAPLPGSPSALASSLESMAKSPKDSAVETVEKTETKVEEGGLPALPSLSPPPATRESVAETEAPQPLEPAKNKAMRGPEVAAQPPVVEAPSLPPLDSVMAENGGVPAGTSEEKKPELPELPLSKSTEDLPQLPSDGKKPEQSSPPEALSIPDGEMPPLPPKFEKVEAKQVSEDVEKAMKSAAEPERNDAEMLNKQVESDVRPVAAQIGESDKGPLPSQVKESQDLPVLTPLPDDESGGLPPLPVNPVSRNGNDAPSLPELPEKSVLSDKADAIGAPEASVKASDETLPALPVVPGAGSEKSGEGLPPLPVPPANAEVVAGPEGKSDQAVVAEEMPPLSPAVGDSKLPADSTLPPLPVTPGAVTEPVVSDSPPAPTPPADEKQAVERIALGSSAESMPVEADQLPPLPAEEIRAGKAEASGSENNVELGRISNRFLAGLSETQRREIEQLARLQTERTGGATPGLSPLSNSAPAAEAGSVSSPRIPRPSSGSSLSAIDDPLVRLELPRAPSPAEARPIRAILLPEQFDNIKQRQYNPRRKMWASAATAHYPLYFQDPSLERYGISVEQRLGTAGRKLTYPIDDPKESKLRNQIATPFFSSGLFALQVATWPFRAIADPPWESEYDLGYYRPGDLVPEDTVVIPWKGVGPLFKGNNY